MPLRFSQILAYPGVLNKKKTGVDCQYREGHFIPTQLVKGHLLKLIILDSNSIIYRLSGLLLGYTYSRWVYLELGVVTC